MSLAARHLRDELEARDQDDQSNVRVPPDVHPLVDELAAGADYQIVANPAYNSDLGQVSLIGVRLQAQF